MPNKVDLSQYQRTLDIGAGKLRQILWYFVNVLVFNSYMFPFSKFKVLLLKWFGARVGNNVVIKPSINIKFPWKLEIGDNSWIGEKVWIDNLAFVSIGNNVVLSQNVLLLCGNHNYKKSSFDLITKDIILEEGVWIGAKSIVAGGVCCRSHSVLSVGSFTASDLEAYSIYSGNPATKLRNRIIE